MVFFIGLSHSALTEYFQPTNLIQFLGICQKFLKWLRNPSNKTIFYIENPRREPIFVNDYIIVALLPKNGPFLRI